MKKSIAQFIGILTAALCCAAAWSAEPSQKPEDTMLPASAYRVPREEIIVEGKRPYWQTEEPPRFDRPKVDAPKPGDSTNRMQWAPHYTHDERDDYNEVRDQLSNPPPRTKIFELHF